MSHAVRDTTTDVTYSTSIGNIHFVVSYRIVYCCCTNSHISQSSYALCSSVVRFDDFFHNTLERPRNFPHRSFITISCWAVVVFFHALVTLVIITIIKFITGGGNPKRDENDGWEVQFRKPRSNSQEQKGD